jgi:hypothetical protein
MAFFLVDPLSSDDRRPPGVRETTTGEREQIRMCATKDGREESAAAKEKS